MSRVSGGQGDETGQHQWKQERFQQHEQIPEMTLASTVLPTFLMSNRAVFACCHSQLSFSHDYLPEIILKSPGKADSMLLLDMMNDGAPRQHPNRRVICRSYRVIWL